MTVPFGFSIGDFVAVTQLINKIWQCARASGSLRTEIETLMQQYATLFNLMHRSLSIHLQGEMSMAPATQRCLELHLSWCREHLEAFDRETSAITEGVRAQKTTSRMMQIGQRIKFMPIHETVFKKLNRHFQHDLQAFELCMDAVIATEQQRNHARLNDLTKNQESFSRSISRSLATLVAVLGDMPKDLGYTWEGGELKRHVTFIHATGEKRVIPLDFWASFEILHGFLLRETKYPGHSRMSRYHYRLTDCSTGISLDAGNAVSWQSLSRPGGKVMLSISMGTWEKWMSTGRYCPKCGSEDIKNALLSGWKRCERCDLEFGSQDIERWPHPSEPIDTRFHLCQTSASDTASESRTEDTPNGEGSGLGFDDAVLAERPNLIGQPCKCVKVVRDDPDRGIDLKRVTMIWAPIWNIVYRASGCMCRLAGDSSRFAIDIDIPWEHPCRLHYPKKMAKALDLEPKLPPDGYDPMQDPYFDRFGGHMAFAAFIATNPIIKRSIDVRSLLPPGTSWFAAAEQLKLASQQENQNRALLDWQDDHTTWYFSWKSRYGEESAKKKQRLMERKSGSKQKTTKRRGSFS